MKYSLSIILIALVFFSKYSFVKATPLDAVNSQIEIYNQTVKTYSNSHQQALTKLSKDIANLNKQKTDALEQNLQTQGDILDEYVKRNKISENGGADGIHRNSDSVSQTRYYLTFAHEAVAYQAAKNYIFYLTSENNIKYDASNLIASFETDLNYARSQVIKSQTTIKNLISK
ncbi:hypothetical protein HY025_00635 [Candidatus Daviesbacteria bacterium]|nr:hypothetical protein [Candidatus Daviesbacteria bacterium]